MAELHAKFDMVMQFNNLVENFVAEIVKAKTEATNQVLALQNQIMELQSEIARLTVENRFLREYLQNMMETQEYNELMRKIEEFKKSGNKGGKEVVKDGKA